MDEAERQASELLGLLSSVWDDRLDDASRAKIEDLLSKDDFAAIGILSSFTRMHLDLECLVSSNAAQAKAMASLTKLRAAQKGAIQRKRSWRAFGGVGLAASVLVCVIYAWYFAPSGHQHLVRPPLPVGKLVHLDNADWTGGTRFQVGDALLEGQTVSVAKGFAQFSMGYGADILLEGPCSAQVAANNRIVLEKGIIAVRAATWASGFKVQTNDMLATDLGTWFSVKSNGGPSELQVLEGQVLAKAVNSSASSTLVRRVTADQAIDLAPDGAFRSITFQRDGTANKLSRFEPLRPIKIWNTGIGLRVGEKDSHWTVTSGNKPVDGATQAAIVCAPHGSYGVNEPDQSQWISVERGTTRGVPARSNFTFETTFDLTGFDLTSVLISGLVLADDGVDEVWLNGQQLNIAAWKDWGYGVIYATFHPIEIRSGFVPGINRLAIVVKNETFIYRAERGFDLPETPNPMALRTEWQAFGRPIVRAKEG